MWLFIHKCVFFGQLKTVLYFKRQNWPPILSQTALAVNISNLIGWFKIPVKQLTALIRSLTMLMVSGLI